jgi:regulator of protease activity HflC (stomatin/prohibitin superfamily)
MTTKQIITSISGAILAIFLLTLVLGSWYTVDEGERTVVTRYGEVVTVSDPGLHFKVPIMDNTSEVSVQEHYARYTNLGAYSNDQQSASLNVSVSYQIDASRVEQVYSEYGDRMGVVDRIITRKTLEQVKVVFGRYNASTAIKERGKLNADMVSELTSSIERSGAPVIILGVQIEDVKFSSVYEDSIEQRMLAEVAVEKEQQNLEREKVLADIVRTKAQADADKVRFAAEAEADAIKMRGQAEAEAIKERADALKNNAALIELVKAENWDGQLPKTMLPNQAVPFIEANK